MWQHDTFTVKYFSWVLFVGKSSSTTENKKPFPTAERWKFQQVHLSLLPSQQIFTFTQHHRNNHSTSATSCHRGKFIFSDLTQLQPWRWQRGVPPGQTHFPPFLWPSSMTSKHVNSWESSDPYLLQAPPSLWESLPDSKITQIYSLLEVRCN